MGCLSGRRSLTLFLLRGLECVLGRCAGWDLSCSPRAFLHSVFSGEGLEAPSWGSPRWGPTLSLDIRSELSLSLVTWPGPRAVPALLDHADAQPAPTTQPAPAPPAARASPGGMGRREGSPLSPGRLSLVG